MNQPTEVISDRGLVDFIIGPMYSGKTTKLCHRVDRDRLAGRDCVIVKFSGDDRYTLDSVIQTHANQRVSSIPESETAGRLRVVTASRLSEIELDPKEATVGVDEGQFYPDLREILVKWLKEGRRVYIAALDGDYCRNPFPAIAESLPLATSIEKLSAVCMLCTRTPRARAYFTVRIIPGSEVFLIGGRETYQAACFACYETACGRDLRS